MDGPNVLLPEEQLEQPEEPLDAVALLVAKQGHEKPVRGCGPGRHPLGPVHQADPEAERVDGRGNRSRRDLAPKRDVQRDFRAVGRDPPSARRIL